MDSYRFFATFGANSPLKNHVIGIAAPTRLVAEMAMIKLFGTNYAFLYEYDHPETGWETQRRQYGLDIAYAIEVTWHRRTELHDMVEDRDLAFKWLPIHLFLDLGVGVEQAAFLLYVACKNVIARWEKGDLGQAARMCQHAVDVAEGKEILKRRANIMAA